MYRLPTPEAGAPSALGVPREVPQWWAHGTGMRLRPRGDRTRMAGLEKLGCAGPRRESEMGVLRAPGETVGHTQVGCPESRLSAALPARAGAAGGRGNHLLRRAPPATCPARCSNHSSQPHQRDQRRGPERFPSSSALAAIFEKGTCPRLGGVSASILFCPGGFLVEFNRPPYLKSCKGRSQRGWSIREG